VSGRASGGNGRSVSFSYGEKTSVSFSYFLMRAMRNPQTAKLPANRSFARTWRALHTCPRDSPCKRWRGTPAHPPRMTRSVFGGTATENGTLAPHRSFETEAALAALLAVSATSLVVWTGLLVLELLSLFERRAVLSLTKKRFADMWHPARLLLLLNTLFNLAVFSLGVAGGAVASMSTTTCDLLYRLLPACYLLAVTCVYLFFISRARIIGSIYKSRKYRIISRCMFWVVLCVPLALVPVCMALYHGHLSATGVCTIEGPPWFALTFAVANLVLSVGLLGLFIVPLQTYVTMLEHNNPAVSNKVTAVAWYNAALTFTSVVATTCAMIFLGVADAVGPVDLGRNEYLVVAAEGVALVNLCINGLLCRAMTDVWIPRRVSHACARLRAPSACTSKLSTPPPRQPSPRTSQHLAQQRQAGGVAVQPSCASATHVTVEPNIFPSTWIEVT
jgi:hypothetical protein